MTTKLQRAQAAHDTKQPPHDCIDDGHKWRVVGNTEDGTVFVKCNVCGKELEQ